MSVIQNEIYDYEFFNQYKTHSKSNSLYRTDSLHSSFYSPSLEVSPFIIQNTIDSKIEQNSFNYNTYIPYESEEMLKMIAKTQKRISNYQKENNFAFSNRVSILGWCERVLNIFHLPFIERESIFHRFATAYDLVNEKLYLNKEINIELNDFKLIIASILLITYKFEGFAIKKITINKLIGLFMRNSPFNEVELPDMIMSIEIKILRLLDYNQFEIDNNIHHLSFILFDLFRRKFCDEIDGDFINIIKIQLIEMNREIQYSNNVVFELYPLDKSAISFFTTMNILRSEKCTSEEINEKVEEFYDYIKYCLKIIQIDKKEVWAYVELFAKEYEGDKDYYYNVNYY